MICGKIAAGKSTLARRLADAPATILISEDVWLATLYRDEQRTVADYARNSRRLRDVMGGHVEALLRAGLSVARLSRQHGRQPAVDARPFREGGCGAPAALHRRAGRRLQDALAAAQRCRHA
jgi:predicted kinase